MVLSNVGPGVPPGNEEGEHVGDCGRKIRHVHLEEGGQGEGFVTGGRINFCRREEGKMGDAKVQSSC